jgi:alpha-beta hydrolase superfamily lysophospholipase
MAVHPNYAATLLHSAWVAAELARCAVRARSLEDVAALAIVRAPNAGRARWREVDGELRIEVGPPPATLSMRVIDVATPRGTIFVLHGIRDTKEAMRGWADVVIAAGYRAVLVDLRGHGRSTGDALTYGVKDAIDLSRALDVLLARRGTLGPIGIMGLSYGASTALQWAGRDPRIAAIVAVAPFASLRDVVPGYLPLAFPAAFVERAIRRAGAIGDFDPDEASAVRSAARTSASLLLLHGGADRRVPPWHSERICAAAAGLAELVVVAGEGHDTVSGSEGAQLAANSVAWFRARL